MDAEIESARPATPDEMRCPYFVSEHPEIDMPVYMATVYPRVTSDEH
jgi:hypothetical protein